MSNSIPSYDAIIVGSGVGGLATAIYLAEQAKANNTNIAILVLSKKLLDTTNSNWAQGGIASVASNEDSFESHVQDTLDAGANQNDPYIVQKVIHAAPMAMQDLIDWGMELDKNQDGSFDLVKEGGHRFSRIWHKADATGQSLQRVLMQKIKQFPAITCIENTTVIQVVQTAAKSFYLETIDREASYHFDANQNDSFLKQYHCKQLVLATGGLGMVYEKTTNQSVATGDGLFLAGQLNASFKDLSYIQFHPTGLFEANSATTFLITEALRGAGAVLRNEKGIDFMQQYDPRGALAPRDIVSRAIMNEIKKASIEYIFLDATTLPSKTIHDHFPNIVAACKHKLGIDISKDWIPVVPVEHYSCGGIEVDEIGAVKGVVNLYAIGELANTGLHGANRLASNSLLEGLVFAKWAAGALYLSLNSAAPNEIMNQVEAYSFAPIRCRKLDWKFLQNCMTNYAGIEKTTLGLTTGLELLQKALDQEVYLESWTITDWENQVLFDVSIRIFKDALKQYSNKGVYFNLDYA